MVKRMSRKEVAGAGLSVRGHGEASAGLEWNNPDDVAGVMELVRIIKNAISNPAYSVTEREESIRKAADALLSPEYRQSMPVEQYVNKLLKVYNKQDALESGMAGAIRSELLRHAKGATNVAQSAELEAVKGDARAAYTAIKSLEQMRETYPPGTWDDVVAVLEGRRRRRRGRRRRRRITIDDFVKRHGAKHPAVPHLLTAIANRGAINETLARTPVERQRAAETPEGVERQLTQAIGKEPLPFQVRQLHSQADNLLSVIRDTSRPLEDRKAALSAYAKLQADVQRYENNVGKQLKAGKYTGEVRDIAQQIIENRGTRPKVRELHAQYPELVGRAAKALREAATKATAQGKQQAATQQPEQPKPTAPAETKPKAKGKGRTKQRLVEAVTAAQAAPPPGEPTTSTSQGAAGQAPRKGTQEILVESVTGQGASAPTTPGTQLIPMRRRLLGGGTTGTSAPGGAYTARYIGWSGPSAAPPGGGALPPVEEAEFYPLTPVRRLFGYTRAPESTATARSTVGTMGERLKGAATGAKEALEKMVGKVKGAKGGGKALLGTAALIGMAVLAQHLLPQLMAQREEEQPLPLEPVQPTLSPMDEYWLRLNAENAALTQQWAPRRVQLEQWAQRQQQLRDQLIEEDKRRTAELLRTLGMLAQ